MLTELWGAQQDEERARELIARFELQLDQHVDPASIRLSWMATNTPPLRVLRAAYAKRIDGRVLRLDRDFLPAGCEFASAHPTSTTDDPPQVG